MFLVSTPVSVWHTHKPRPYTRLPFLKALARILDGWVVATQVVNRRRSVLLAPVSAPWSEAGPSNRVHRLLPV